MPPTNRRKPAGILKLSSDKAAIKAGCYFDITKAENVRKFFTDFLCHSKGEFAGKPFELLPWQWRDVVAPLFGWLRPDGTRRFRRAYIEVAKKNGKTTLAAGLSLYLLIGDNEPGAEVYSAAADRDQASIIFHEAANMVRASKELSSHIMVTDSRKILAYPRQNSIYRALSAEVATKEGLNIHGLLFDELHAQKTRDLWDALTYGGASRRQPLLIAITTAGWDRNSICWEQHEYAQRIIEGTYEDWSFFPYIRAAGEEDDWTKLTTWKKANPSLGVTIHRTEFAESCREAQISSTKENAFKRYRLNIWTQQDVRWLRLEDWDKCGAACEVVEGDLCFAGLDLSTTTDITNLSLLFPKEDGSYDLLPFFWIPEDGARERERRDKVPYLTWAREGLITMTPGNVIDYERIRQQIIELSEIYNIHEIAIDPWNATQIATQLEGDGFEVLQFRQGYASMTSPTKELEKLVLGGRLRHGGNPVMRWMAGNVAVEMDAAGNLKPSKAKSTERIDGIVGTVMALGRALTRSEEPRSVYEDRGILVI